MKIKKEISVFMFLLYSFHPFFSHLFHMFMFNFAMFIFLYGKSSFFHFTLLKLMKSSRYDGVENEINIKIHNNNKIGWIQNGYLFAIFSVKCVVFFMFFICCHFSTFISFLFASIMLFHFVKLFFMEWRDFGMDVGILYNFIVFMWN